MPASNDAPRYVVAYTATDEGQDALTFANRLAQVTQAKLDLVTVLHSEDRATLVPEDASFSARIEGTVSAWLTSAAKSIVGGLSVRSRMIFAPSSAEGILAFTDQERAALIIIGARATGMMGRFTLGGVANDLLHASPVPVAVVPRGARTISPGTPVTRLTILAEKPEGNEEVFRVAERIAARTHIPVRLVSLHTRDLPKYPGDDAVAAGESTARDALREVTQRFATAGIPVEHVVAQGKDIAVALTTIEWRSDEIAMIGSSRLAPPRRLFLGSTAGKIAREIPVPLIVMHRENA